MNVARIYLRVSTDEQDLTRQQSIIEQAKANGLYVAAVYKEKASGARADRPELLRLIADLQPGEIVVAEKLDRISRLPLPEAEKLIGTIKDKGAKLSVPGLVDLSDLAAESDGIPRIVIDSIQDMLMKIALQIAREDYETRRERQKQGIVIAKGLGKFSGRKADLKMHARILEVSKFNSISKTAQLLECSEAQVKRVKALYKENKKIISTQ